MSEFEAYGYTADVARAFAAEADPDDVVGRVIGIERTVLRVITAEGERPAITTARFRRGANKPAVGDWVVLQTVSGDENLVIRKILPRKSALSRISGTRRDTDGTTTGRPVEQVLSANVDHVIVMTGLDEDFSINRIERFVAGVRAGGSQPVLLLNKADLVAADQARAQVEAVRDAFPGVPVFVLSLEDTPDLEVLKPYVRAGTTTAIIGSSGVGKSTLINRLLGEEAALTGETRSGDGKGRHTTTWREMFRLPGGGVIIDNPGLRETGALAAEAISNYADIEELTYSCKFRSCTHVSEPGCAVLAGIESGELDPERVNRWRQAASESEDVRVWLDESERRQGRRRRE